MHRQQSPLPDSPLSLFSRLAGLAYNPYRLGLPAKINSQRV